MPCRWKTALKVVYALVTVKAVDDLLSHMMQPALGDIIALVHSQGLPESYLALLSSVRASL